MKQTPMTFMVICSAIVMICAGGSQVWAETDWELNCDSGKVFTWQANITDALGNPIAPGNYSLHYCYYLDSLGGAAIGCCTTQAVVSTSSKSLPDGRAANFSIARASIIYAQPIFEDTTKSGRIFQPQLPIDVWIEMTFDDEVMTPRTLITDAPVSGSARRVYGDVFSKPGQMWVKDANLTNSAVVDLKTDDATAAMRLFSPSADSIPAVVMRSSDDESVVELFDSEGSKTIAISNHGKACIGPGNNNPGAFAFVVGKDNTASGDSSVVSGGASNTASGSKSTVGGGRGNNATDVYATISGGAGNAADDDYTTVGGGQNNTASGLWSTAGGGLYNVASGELSFAGGGAGSEATGLCSAISGGENNTAGGNYSTISGGYNNRAAGDFSVIPGGRLDTLTSNASFSMAFGHHVYLNNQYRVALYDSVYPGRLAVNRDDHSSGGIAYPIHVGTTIDDGNGAYLTGGGAWTDASSREFKENFHQLDGQDVLRHIGQLPIESWEYKGTGERHIWPCAEDFHEAFDVGVLKKDGTRDNRYLAAGDIAGVVLIGVQELYRITNELQQKSQEIDELRTQVAQLQALVETILAQKDRNNKGNEELAVSKLDGGIEK